MLQVLIYAENFHMKFPLKLCKLLIFQYLNVIKKMLGFMLCFANEISVFQLLQSSLYFSVF